MVIANGGAATDAAVLRHSGRTNAAIQNSRLRPVRQNF
jgi:hypothetical protein